VRLEGPPPEALRGYDEIRATLERDVLPDVRERAAPSGPGVRVRDMVEPSDEPFGVALRELMLGDGDIYVSESGNVKWGTFAHVLHGVSYDVLRRTVRGERPPTLELMEECARVLQVWPTYFAEYRAAGFARQAAA